MSLPASYTWTLAPDPTPPSSGGDGPSVVPGAGGACSPRYFTQAQLLDLFERLLPESYLTPLKSPGPGYELLQAWAKMWERVSLAGGRAECGLFITTAHAGDRATTVVEFYRENALAGAVTVLAGTVVTTSAGGRDFTVLSDAVFGAFDVGPVVAPVRAVAEGCEYNVTGQRITAAGEVLPGEINTISLPIQAPAFGDPTIRVRQLADATGGGLSMLDAHGADRDMPRSPGELDDNYRVRVRALPETVSPEAVDAAVSHLLSAGVISGFRVAETWQVDYQTCWDSPSVGMGVNPRFSPTTFVYDDPRPITVSTFRNRWLSELDYRGAFFVVVPRDAAVRDYGMDYDDTAALPTDLVTPRGRRASCAYDVPRTATVLQGCYDGYDVGAAANYAGLYNLLQQIKAGGVYATVEIAPDYPA